MWKKNGFCTAFHIESISSLSIYLKEPNRIGNGLKSRFTLCDMCFIQLFLYICSNRSRTHFNLIFIPIHPIQILLCFRLCSLQTGLFISILSSSWWLFQQFFFIGFPSNCVLRIIRILFYPSEYTFFKICAVSNQTKPSKNEFYAFPARV